MEMPWQPGLKTCSGTDSAEERRYWTGSRETSNSCHVLIDIKRSVEGNQLRGSCPSEGCDS